MDEIFIIEANYSDYEPFSKVIGWTDTEELAKEIVNAKNLAERIITDEIEYSYYKLQKIN